MGLLFERRCLGSDYASSAADGLRLLQMNDERLKLFCISMNTLLFYFGKPMIHLVICDISQFRGIN